MLDINIVRREVERLVDDLVEGRLHEIVLSGRAGVLSAEHIKAALNDYPGALTHPPRKTFDDLDVRQVRSAKLPTYYVEFDLWIDGDRSDLTLSCTVTITGAQTVVTEIDNIHVL